MVGKAVEELCGIINRVPQGDEEWQRKAEIIGEFADRVSDYVLKKAGFNKKSTRNQDLWSANSIAKSQIDPEAMPDDCFTVLWLCNVPASFTTNRDYFNIAHEIAFCSKRVLLVESDYTDDSCKILKVMTYEEAARFVIFWLAEKILQIIRKNNWDRVKELPDLFDRLATFFVAEPQPTQRLAGGVPDPRD
jgi:hypothetical protein